MQSTSYQLKMYLAELGVGAKFKMSELRTRWPEDAGGVSGFINRAEKAGGVKLVGSIPTPNNKPDRMFQVTKELAEMKVYEHAPVRAEGYSRSNEGPRAKTKFGASILTREQVRDKLLELATYFDTNPLNQYTEQELIAELSRRYEAKEKK